MTTSQSVAVMVSSVQEQSYIQRAASHLMKSELHYSAHLAEINYGLIAGQLLLSSLKVKNPH